MRIALVRHTALNQPPGRCYGRLDLPLADSAELDIAELRERLVERLGTVADAWLWTSPAGRCRRLAEAIAVRTGGAAVADGRLSELDFGAWEGLAWELVPRAELDRWAADPLAFCPPGGESGAALVARATSFFEEIAATRGDHVVVSHGGPLRVLLALAHGRPVDLLAPAPPIGSVEMVEL